MAGVTAFLNWQGLLGLTFADWDTHDYFFPQFLYFVDSLRGGAIPWWNPFIQSGVFFPTLHNIGFFLPFYQVFSLLGLLVSPLLALEWAVVALQFLGCLGLYLLLLAQRHRPDVALFGAVAYLTSVLWVNIGQISILASFATLPWLLVAAHLIKTGRVTHPTIAFLGMSTGMALACGYPWLSAVNMPIMVGYYVALDFSGLFKSSHSRLQLVLFLLCCGLTYTALILPGYADLMFNYSRFAGDFVSPDDRLRGLTATTAVARYRSFLTAVAASIDPAIYERTSALWTLGVGWSVFSLAALRLFTPSPMRRPEWFWLAVALTGLCYAAAVPPLGALVSKLPVLNANRFLILANHFVVLAWIMIATSWLQSMSGLASLRLFEVRESFRSVVFVCVLGVLAAWLYVSGASALAYMMLFGSIALVFIAWKLGLQHYLALSLLVVNVVGFEIALYRFPAVPDKARAAIPSFAEKVRTRTVRVAATTTNHRELGRQTFYAYDNFDWSITKTPSSHGYNNLGNPLYWYMKDQPFLESIFDINDKVRPAHAAARAAVATDNIYAEGLAADVAAAPDIPVATTKPFSAGVSRPRIVQMKLAPNVASATVEASGHALVLFNNVFAPGWRVTVDDRASNIVPVNYIFMGVEITTPGWHVVEFRFFPTVAVLAISGVYLAWFATGAMASVSAWKRRRGHVDPEPLISA